MAIDISTRETPPPGIYRGVPAPHYHGWKAASSSRLRVLAKAAPAQLEHETKSPSKSTEAQRFGTLGHTLVLQPQLFEDLYAVFPPGNKNSNDYKTARGRILADRPFVTLVEAEEIARARRAKKEIDRHVLAAAAFRDGDSEVSIVWLDSETGVLCKARVDSVVQGVGMWDLKFTGSVEEKAIARKVEDFRLDIQAAFYLRGATQAGLEIPADFGFCFVEDDGIHEIRMDVVSHQVLVAAEEEVDELLELWARCTETGVWPRRPQSIGTLPVTYQMQRRAEERVGELRSVA